MTQESWLEPKSKIPFVGIIAIVLIVAIVAIFIKTGLSPLFPSSDIKVQDGNSLTGNVVASSSSSFAGIREVELIQKERLQSIINTKEKSLSFVVDVADQSMTISNGKVTEQVLLDIEGQRLYKTFDFNGQQTRVDIYLGDRLLRYNEEGKSATPFVVPLSEIAVYEGSFKFKNQYYTFLYRPAMSDAQIQGATTVTIPLTRKDNTYTGTWQDGSFPRPVIVDLAQRKATIQDVY